MLTKSNEIIGVKKNEEDNLTLGLQVRALIILYGETSITVIMSREEQLDMMGWKRMEI